jgi:hypothetical protein
MQPGAAFDGFVLSSSFEPARTFGVDLILAY